MKTPAPCPTGGAGVFRLQRLLELGRVAAAGLVEHGHTDAHSGIGGGVFRCGIHPASAVRRGFQCLPLFDLFPIAFAQGTAHRDINFSLRDLCVLCNWLSFRIFRFCTALRRV